MTCRLTVYLTYASDTGHVMDDFCGDLRSEPARPIRPKGNPADEQRLRAASSKTRTFYKPPIRGETQYIFVLVRSRRFKAGPQRPGSCGIMLFRLS